LEVLAFEKTVIGKADSEYSVRVVRYRIRTPLCHAAIGLFVGTALGTLGFVKLPRLVKNAVDLAAPERGVEPVHGPGNSTFFFATEGCRIGGIRGCSRRWIAVLVQKEPRVVENTVVGAELHDAVGSGREELLSAILGTAHCGRIGIERRAFCSDEYITAVHRQNSESSKGRS